jgi:hypothetical protein
VSFPLFRRYHYDSDQLDDPTFHIYKKYIKDSIEYGSLLGENVPQEKWNHVDHKETILDFNKKVMISVFFPGLNS